MPDADVRRYFTYDIFSSSSVFTDLFQLLRFVSRDLVRRFARDLQTDRCAANILPAGTRILAFMVHSPH